MPLLGRMVHHALEAGEDPSVPVEVPHEAFIDAFHHLWATVAELRRHAGGPGVRRFDHVVVDGEDGPLTRLRGCRSAIHRDHRCSGQTGVRLSKNASTPSRTMSSSRPSAMIVRPDAIAA